MKKILLCIFASVLILGAFPIGALAVENNAPFDLNAKSAVLMDAASGEVLYAKNADEALPPASVTKVMTLLLVMEAIERGELKYEDTVSVSKNAASMGGSQVYLEEGEEMTVDEMLKCVVVSSANDAAVALCERIGGSEGAFISRMNERARELGMNNTNFENATGLDDDTVNHVTSAYDIALMSRELVTRHRRILDYSTIWMDTVRDGKFGLSNTNRLIRFYNGATGLKTGSTSRAGFCISATAEREGMSLIAVIMGSQTRDERNDAAKMLLDFGFSTYSVYKVEGGELGEIKLLGGTKEKIGLSFKGFEKLLGRGLEKKITVETDLPDSLSVPIKRGDAVGRIKYVCDGKIIGEVNICANEDAEKIGFFQIFNILLKKCILK